LDLDLDSLLILRSRDDPSWFSEHVLERPPLFEHQRRWSESVVGYRTTVLFTGNALGKDYWVGGLVPWWLYTRSDALCLVTGPSQTAIASITWREIRRAVQGSQIMKADRPFISSGQKTSPAVLRLSDGSTALGFSTTSVERLSGHHSPNLLVIIEEASGIEPHVWEAVSALQATKVVAIGNPLRPDGGFVDLIRQGDLDRRDDIPRERSVNAIQMPSTASPHAHLERSPVGLADATWLADCKRRYGEHSQWWKAHVLARVPDVANDALIDPKWLDRASSFRRQAFVMGTPWYLASMRTRRIAVDLSEGVGRDECCILVRDCYGIIDLFANATTTPAEAAAKIARLAREYHVPPERITYDRAGSFGKDMKFHMQQHGLHMAIGFAGYDQAQNYRRYPNRRSECAWNLRARLDPTGEWGHIPFAIPSREWLPLLRADLEALEYDLTTGKDRLIRKEDVCAKLGRSCDRGDALAQSFVELESPSGIPSPPGDMTTLLSRAN
jgi:hypothetical protein